MSAIASLKLSILKTLCAFTRFRCRLKGMSFGKGCFVDGMPSLRFTRGSRIELGEDVTLISNPRHNPLLQHPVTLRTLLPEATISIGSHAGISGSRIVCCNKISIGEYTIIGPDCLIYDSEGHDYSEAEGWRGRKKRSGRPISIGEKCFIGARCMILSGVTIGNRCVIAAGSVITSDVPDGHKASGNPATLTPLPKILGGCGRKMKQNNP